MNKVFSVTVLDESQQSMRIMDVKGYSHMSEARTVRLGMTNYTVRDAYIIGHKNKSELKKQIKEALDIYYWSSINDPQLYDRYE